MTDNTQQILIPRDGRQFGPYSPEEVERYLVSGHILPTDAAQADGGDWLTVEKILAPHSTPPKPSITPPPPIEKPKPTPDAHLENQHPATDDANHTPGVAEFGELAGSEQRKLKAKWVIAIIALLAVGGLALVMGASSSKPPKEKVEGMFADYLEQTRGAMGNSHNLSSAKDVLSKVAGMTARDAGFGHIKALDITNEYKRTVDGESRYYYEADISTFYGDQFIANNGAVANLTTWRGSISCVKRGKEWYWYAESSPETVAKPYRLSADEQLLVNKGRKKMQEIVGELENYKSKIYAKLTNTSSFEELDNLWVEVYSYFEENSNKLIQTYGISTPEMQRIANIKNEIGDAVQQKRQQMIGVGVKFVAAEADKLIALRDQQLTFCSTIREVDVVKAKMRESLQPIENTLKTINDWAYSHSCLFDSDWVIVPPTVQETRSKIDSLLDEEAYVVCETKIRNAERAKRDAQEAVATAAKDAQMHDAFWEDEISRASKIVAAAHQRYKELQKSDRVGSPPLHILGAEFNGYIDRLLTESQSTKYKDDRKFLDLKNKLSELHDTPLHAFLATRFIPDTPDQKAEAKKLADTLLQINAAPSAKASPVSAEIIANTAEKGGTSDAEFQAIQKVVATELRATSSGDIEALLSVYSDKVDYFDKGVVGRDVVRADSKAYSTRWPVFRCELKGNIGVEKLNATDRKLTFTVAFNAENPKAGRVSRGNTLATWIVRFDIDGRDCKIISQREEVAKPSKQAPKTW